MKNILKLSVLTSPEFWVGAGERAIKAFSYTLLALMGTNAVGIEPAIPSIGIHEFDWLYALSVASFAAIVSIVGSVSSASPLVPIKEPAASVHVKEIESN